MVKKILIDCKVISQKVSGIRGYFLPYLRALTSLLSDYHFVLISPTPLSKNIGINWANCSNLVIPYRSFLPHPYFKDIVYGLFDFPNTIKKIDADLLISSYYDFLIPKRYAFRSVITVHDLCYWDLHQCYDWHTKWFPYFVLPHNLKRTGGIITGSEFGKKRIVERFKDLVLNKQITVLYSTFVRKNQNSERQPLMIQRLKQKLKLKNSYKYLLYTGGVENRKNIDRMLAAYRQVVDSNSVQLVFTGDNKEHSTLLKLLSKHQVTEHVVLSGVLSSEEIDLLYSKICHGALNLSLYEGFGRNTYESKQHGLPVLCSDIDVAREVAREYPLYCDPTNINDIREKILLLLQKKRNKPQESIDERFKEKPNTERMIRMVERFLEDR